MKPETAKRLGKNSGGYFGELIAIDPVLLDIKQAAARHGWALETFCKTDRLELVALTRAATQSANPKTRNIYLSAGIHGDEPAGPLAVHRLLLENRWPENVSLWICPCLNPSGFVINKRENSEGMDLNRQYHGPQSDEVRAHVAWLQRQPRFDLTLLLHEDWESNGFYVYELNTAGTPSLAEKMVESVSAVCPVDTSETIEGRAAKAGIIRPDIDLAARPLWPEAFYLVQHKTDVSYTLEAPSDFALQTRVDALVVAVHAALGTSP